MKALTLHQPWAALVAVGVKTVETRGWATSYRGPLLIHAGKVKADPRDPVWQHGGLTDPTRPGLLSAGYTPMAFGAYVALCNLVAVVPVEQIGAALREQNEPFGNFAAGRFAWVLEDVAKIDPPDPARGFQGLWTPYDRMSPPCTTHSVATRTQQ